MKKLWLILSVAAVAGIMGCTPGPAPVDEIETAVETPAGAPEEEAAVPADEKLTIGLMPKLVGIEYFNATERGAREAAGELDVKVDYNGPVTPDVQKQVEMIETWIAKEYNAIAVAPNDPDAISQVLTEARDMDATVVAWDADAHEEARDWFVNQATSESIAHTLMDLMARNVGEDAKYVILTGTLTAANQNIWMAEMEKYRQEKYPAMTNLSANPWESGESQETAMQRTQDILKAYPDLQGIFAITSVALPGAAEALRKADAAGKVFLTGLTTPNMMKQHLREGTVREFVLWNAEDLGYLTIYVATASIRGDLKPGATSFKAGKLGEVEVNGSEVILGPPIVFTPENIDQFDF